MRFARPALALTLALTVAGCGTLVPPAWMIAQQRSMITDHQRFDNAPIPASRERSVLPVAAQPLALPPLLPDETAEALMARQGTVALLVLRDGQVAYERYFNGRQRDTLLTSFSMAKSVVALLLGQAIRDGRIASTDDPVTRYLPELATQDPRFAQVRLRDLLAMRSGIAFQEEYTSPWSDVAIFYLTPNLGRAVAGMKIAEPPDRRYRYSSGDTQLLGMVVERATGRRLHQLAADGLWGPIGAEMDASWSLDSALQGQAKAFCCLNARAIDYARIGQMMLDRGRVDGRQVVPERWIDELLAVRELPGDTPGARRNIESPGRPDAVFYTWQWRRMPQGPLAVVPDPAAVTPPEQMVPGTDFYAQGQHGQYIYVAPEQRTVVVRLGTDRKPGLWWPGMLGRIARAGLGAAHPPSVAAAQP
ncbi:MAG: hypothetical protein RL456_1776 [Pseudomonadota bacterium]|jgi:CubicO group peptidase (beta-lactamase class C family)